MSSYYWTLLSAISEGGTGFGYRYGYEFDGVDENLNFGNVLNNDGSSAFTISFWLKGVTNSDWIISKQTKRYEGLEIFSGGSRHLELSFGRASTDRIACRSTNTMSSLDWVFCTVSYDGSKSVSGVKMYLNGVEETIVTNRDTWTGSSLNSGDLRFGSIPWTSGLRLNGRLDDVQYYNSVLSLSDINDIYNSGYVTAPTAGPIHHWKLGEEDTFSTNWTVKDSVGSLDGTSVNMEEVDRKLGVAYSLDFDGVDEEISFPNYDISGPFSVSVWFKLIDSGDNVMIGDWGSGTRSWLLRTSSGKVQFFTSEDGITNNLLQTTLTYNDNSWHNVLVTFGSTGGKRIYLDGSLASSVSTYYVVYNSSNNLLIGDYAFGGNNFNGNLMEVSIFDSELSASDVALLFNETGTGNGVPIDPRNVGLSPTFYCPMVGPNDSFSTNWTITDEIAANNGTSVNMEEADKTSETP